MRALLVVLAVGTLVAVAGCPVAGGVTTQQPTGTETPAPVPGTETVDTARDTLTPQPYPQRPVTLTRTAARQFVTAYERALGWNRRLSDGTVALSVSVVRSSIRTDTGSGYVVRVEVGVSRTVRRDGSRTVGDGYYTAAYLVNESTVMRAATGGQARPGPDPRNGTVLSVPS